MIEAVAAGPQKDRLDDNAGTAIAPKALVDCFLPRLSVDLARRFGRGFGADNLELMRLFYQSFPPGEISESVIRKSGKRSSDAESESAIRHFPLQQLAERFPLSWTKNVTRSDTEDRLSCTTGRLSVVDASRRQGWYGFVI